MAFFPSHSSSSACVLPQNNNQPWRCQAAPRFFRQHHLALQTSTGQLQTKTPAMTGTALRFPVDIFILAHKQVFQIASLRAGNPVRVPSYLPLNVRWNTSDNYGYQGIGIDFKYQMTELCYRSLSSGESIVYTTSTLGAGFQTSTTTLDSGGVNAYGVEIRWRVSSPASATTFTTSDLHLSGVSSSTSSTTETSAARTLDSEPAPQRIPAGAGAGIGIGAAAATALILVGLFLLWRRKRKHRTRQTPAHDTLPLGGNLRPVDRISGYTGSDRSNSARPTQLQSHYSTEWSEMRHASPPVELGSA
ncbi:hypothetical protein F4774DRAFT_409584 [Daldinia eschscholtzii]|nr:hypothetical protein F4774DRAFT_409584 [Daldinia eschscholtzii]